MTKSEIVAKVAANTGLTREGANVAVETVMETIIEAVGSGRSVFLRGFGTFTRKHRAEKKARNITRGTSITIPAHDVPHFRPSPYFRQKLTENK